MLFREKQSSLLESFISCKEIETLLIRSQESYSQNFIFFATFSLAQKAGVLYYIRLDMLAREKHPSLFYSFISYKEIEALLIWSQESYSQHFILFVTIKLGQ